MALIDTQNANMFVRFYYDTSYFGAWACFTVTGGTGRWLYNLQHYTFKNGPNKAGYGQDLLPPRQVVQHELLRPLHERLVAVPRLLILFSADNGSYPLSACERGLPGRQAPSKAPSIRCRVRTSPIMSRAARISRWSRPSMPVASSGLSVATVVYPAPGSA